MDITTKHEIRSADVNTATAKMSRLARLLILLSAALMVGTYFVPVWEILMWAPQYPEGLEMQIWLNTLSGDYKIISGLNHYIGMKHIEVEMFPEFEYMVYIVGGLILTGLAAAAINRKFMAVVFAVALLLAGTAGMVDFYQWGYDYGHNLDPTAPIIVPGMAYQPPLIGTKQLLNFTAYSGPDAGGYLFLASGLLAIGAVVLEYRRRKNIAAMLSFVVVVLISSCSVEPEPIAYGKDSCHACRMTLMDKRFGSEIVTRKGKVFKFDDVNCMNRFMSGGEIAESDIALLLITDFANPGTLIPVSEALFVESPEIKSPMGSNIAAFSKKDDIGALRSQWLENVLSWETISQENNPDKHHHN